MRCMRWRSISARSSLRQSRVGRTKIAAEIRELARNHGGGRLNGSSASCIPRMRTAPFAPPGCYWTMDIFLQGMELKDEQQEDQNHRWTFRRRRRAPMPPKFQNRTLKPDERLSKSLASLIPLRERREGSDRRPWQWSR
jgi:hypothetical protein